MASSLAGILSQVLDPLIKPAGEVGDIPAFRQAAMDPATNVPDEPLTARVGPEATPTNTDSPGNDTETPAPAVKQSNSKTSNSKTSTTDSPATTAVKATDEQSLPSIEQAAMQPYEDELSALPAEYQAAMAGLGETVGPGEPGSSTPGSGQLAAPETAENNAQAKGDEGIYNALTKEVTAGQTAVKDLPYSDIVTSLLANAKNQIQYGSTPSTYTPNEQAWSQQMKDIYGYLQGTTATTGAASTGTSVPGLPSAVQAATGSDVGSVPGSGGAGAGQA